MRWDHTHPTSTREQRDTPGKRALGCAFDMLKFFGALLLFIAAYAAVILGFEAFAGVRGWSMAGAGAFLVEHWWESLTIAAVLFAEEIGLMIVLPLVRYIITGERR